MRWRSRFAIGALVLLPVAGASGAAFADATNRPLPQRLDAVARTLSAQHSSDAAVISDESRSRGSGNALRPVLANLRTEPAVALGAWATVVALALLVVSTGTRLAPRGRAPPLRFL
jgi:hypothetical protein